MEIRGDEILLKTINELNNLSIEEVLKGVKNGVRLPERENQLVRALEIGFVYCASKISIEIVEDKLFKYICPAGENLVVKQLQNLENVEITNCCNSLNTCSEVIDHFSTFFISLNFKVNICFIESWLLSSIRIIYFCFQHCEKSEKIYGPRFEDSANYLSNLFKKCCTFVEKLINIFSEFDLSNEGQQTKILNELLTYLSRCGNILFDLEIKTMAKVWKGFVFLLEATCSYIKNEFYITETIESLCSRVNNNINEILKSQSQNVLKLVKLSSFLLKLIIKICQSFAGLLNNCHNSLITLILSLIKCKISVGDESLAELTLGTDPLVSQLMPDNMFIRSFGKMIENVSENDKTGPEFCVICCLMCQKLVDCPANTRILWFNQKNNILDWLFQSLSYCQSSIFRDFHMPGILVSGKQRKFSEVYEYSLVTASAYLLTMSSFDFGIAEKILIKNVLQSVPFKALLATDIWCLLARFGDSSLCFSQIQKLSQIFLKMKRNTLQMEKLYLRSLIQRLYFLLTENQKDKFKGELGESFLCDLWATDGPSTGASNFPLASLLATIRPHNTHPTITFDTLINDKVGTEVVNLWKFNCKILLNCYQNVRYLKVLCALTTYTIPLISSENLYLLLSQLRKMADLKQTDLILHFTWILNCLASVRVPADAFQKNIFELETDVFRRMLLSQDVLVKIKTLETFYRFSHVTTHSNIIALTVHNAPSLKSEIADYFKKNFPSLSSFCVDEFVQKLCHTKYEHKCNLGPRTNLVSSRNMKKVILRWKEDGENLIKNVNDLTESQKKEIVYICSQMNSIFQ